MRKTNLDKYREGREKIQQILIDQTIQAILKDMKNMVLLSEVEQLLKGEGK